MTKYHSRSGRSENHAPMQSTESTNVYNDGTIIEQNICRGFPELKQYLL